MHAYVICDLGYGDAGKGTITDWLAREVGADCVVRHNGGAQAAHNVITPDGRHHTFAQFGSGTFVDGVRTHLSRYMLVNPLNLLVEEAHLRQLGVHDAFDRLSVDARAPITTPFHIAATQLREIARGQGRHGSCGLGIGETMIDLLAGHAVRAGQLGDGRALRAALRDLQAHVRQRMLPVLDQIGRPASQVDEAWPLYDPAAPAELADLYGEVSARVSVLDAWAPAGDLIFEGAQGVLLDEWRGFHPHTTWSTTTTANADTLLDGYAGQVTRVGLMRAYMTRHGAGPFVTESDKLTREIPDAHNGWGAWQGGWRVGWTDLEAIRYALTVAGPIDCLAVTCLDRIAGREDWQVCTAYEVDGQRWALERPRHAPEDLDVQEKVTSMLMRAAPVLESVPTDQLVERIENELGLPVAITSHGPSAADKRLRATIA